MEHQSAKSPKHLITVASTVVILCWLAFIAKTLIDGAADVVQVLIMLIFSILVAWLVVSDSHDGNDGDSDTNFVAQGSSPFTTISQKVARDNAEIKDGVADKANESLDSSK